MKMIVSTIAILSLSVSVAFAQKGTEMTKEERTKAAELHEKMAGCLRTDKPMQACHDEVKASCGDDKNCKMWSHQGEGKMKAMMNKAKAKTQELTADAKAKMNSKTEEVKQETK